MEEQVGDILLRVLYSSSRLLRETKVDIHVLYEAVVQEWPRKPMKPD